MIKRRRTIGLLFLVAITILFSCSDKKEYNMELAFQREMVAQGLQENDRIFLRIQKEIADNGDRDSDIVIRDHAASIINLRNKYIDSISRVDVLMGNIKEVIQIADNDDSNAVILLNYYRNEVHQKNDSLLFQKFITVYLTFEQKMLDENLTSVSGSCNWGSDLRPHVTKTTDTVAVGKLYELAVIPATFNYKASYITDSCKITVYRNGVPFEMKNTVARKGFVYLIALTPTQSGDYKIRGSFTQGAYGHSYVMENVFTDTFVVK